VSTTTVWAVEVFVDGHWSVIEGGLSKPAAESCADVILRARGGERLSIAEYVDEESGALVSREEVQS
jgi:hypothetical protein